MPRQDISRILFIDAYDSFSNNIVSLLETRLSAIEVTIIKIDQDIPDFPAYLRHFDAVVAGPGPGHPENAADVGLIAQLWQLGDQHVLPVLGICLGFQSLVIAFGGTVLPLPEPRHGIVRNVTFTNTSTFHGVKHVSPVQYHSLHALLGRHDLCLEKPLKSDHDLEALAWDIEADNQGTDQIEAHKSNPNVVLMAVKHRRKPFFGLQFHPESICSNQASQRLVDHWWAEAQQWNLQRKSQTRAQAHNVDPRNSEMLLKATDPFIEVGAFEGLSLHHISHPTAGGDVADSPKIATVIPSPVIRRVLPLDELNVPHIWDVLQFDEGDAVVLDAEPHQRADTGTHSIIGILGPTMTKLEYTVGSGTVRLCQAAYQSSIDLASFDNSALGYIKAFMSVRKATGGDLHIPFWGGLVGYINYEACLETIDISSSGHPDKPDISFVFIERSIVIDHQRQQVHVQSIKPRDDEWVETISSQLAIKPKVTSRPHLFQFDPSVIDSVVSYPDPNSYAEKIRMCQDYIHSGDSYELCLTNQATINSRHLRSPWPMYLHLRSLNAAPFSAYMRLGGMTLLSSSPERFMRWTRPTVAGSSTTQTSVVQFRPIKGTVKRYPDGPDGPAITLEEATALLSTPKERAENLMIVDLIRHDLHGVVGSGNICVPKLMVVEEYATLFQLVTVVEGTLINQSTTLSNVPSLTTSADSSPGTSRPVTPSLNDNNVSPHKHAQQPTSLARPAMNKTGIDVLAASLPPGSMTGAPKRRSCALLRQIEEQKPRGIYSGVVGYMDVGGGGDFSVVIRSAFRWDSDTSFDRDRQEMRDTWTVGAGGAITALSTEEGEWEEMVAKLGSTLRVFG
ncbi:MAG: hypothetical protein Q9213_001387 [Squamulea squamosa]